MKISTKLDSFFKANVTKNAVIYTQTEHEKAALINIVKNCFYESTLIELEEKDCFFEIKERLIQHSPSILILDFDAFLFKLSSHLVSSPFIALCSQGRKYGIRIIAISSSSNLIPWFTSLGLPSLTNNFIYFNFNF